MTLLMTHMATPARNGMTTLHLDVDIMMILISSPQISVALAVEEQSKIQTLLNLSLKHALMMTRLKILMETLAQIGTTITLLVVEITMMWTLLHLSNAVHAMVAVKMKTAVAQNFHKPQMKNALTMTQLAIKMETHALDGMTPILQDVETMTMSYSKPLTDVASVEVDVKIQKAVT